LLFHLTFSFLYTFLLRLTVDYFNYLGSVITNDARCTREIKSKIATAKTEFNKKTVIASTLDLNLRKKLVKCFI